MRVMMQAEHGFSSETYDFTEVFVETEGKTILREVWFGKFRAFFGWVEGVAYYGHSYGAREQLCQDLHDKKITIPVVVK